jgi:hypothetical protein
MNWVGIWNLKGWKEIKIKRKKNNLLLGQFLPQPISPLFTWCRAPSSLCPAPAQSHCHHCLSLARRQMGLVARIHLLLPPKPRRGPKPCAWRAPVNGRAPADCRAPQTLELSRQLGFGQSPRALHIRPLVRSGFSALFANTDWNLNKSRWNFAMVAAALLHPIGLCLPLCPVLYNPRASSQQPLPWHGGRRSSTVGALGLGGSAGPPGCPWRAPVRISRPPILYRCRGGFITGAMPGLAPSIGSAPTNSPVGLAMAPVVPWPWAPSSPPHIGSPPLSTTGRQPRRTPPRAGYGLGRCAHLDRMRQIRR